MAISGTFNLRLDFLEAVAQDLGDKQYKMLKGFLKQFTDGTGANQVQKLYADILTTVQSVNTDLDLNPGPTGAFGAVLFTTLKGIIVLGDDLNPGDLTVGNVTNGIVGPFAAATNSVKVPPGGAFVALNPSATGWTVTAGTADLLRIATAATVGNYTSSILLLGT